MPEELTSTTILTSMEQMGAPYESADQFHDLSADNLAALGDVLTMISAGRLTEAVACADELSTELGRHGLRLTGGWLAAQARMYHSRGALTFAERTYRVLLELFRLRLGVAASQSPRVAAIHGQLALVLAHSGRVSEAYGHAREAHDVHALAGPNFARHLAIDCQHLSVLAELRRALSEAIFWKRRAIRLLEVSRPIPRRYFHQFGVRLPAFANPAPLANRLRTALQIELAELLTSARDPSAESLLEYLLSTTHVEALRSRLQAASRRLADSHDTSTPPP